MDKIGILVNGGIGDILQIGGILDSIEDGEREVKIFVAARTEIFEVIVYLFNQYEVIQVPEELVDKVLNNEENFQEFKEASKLTELYLFWPDLLFRHPHSFDYKKYHTHPQKIKQFRYFQKLWFPQNKIYLGLSTTTEGYLYNNCGALIRMLGNELPNHEVVFPLVKKWDNKNIDYGNLENLPSNITIIENPNLIECLDIMESCCFGIATCNFISHYLYSIGMPRLILDPQYEKSAFISRWKEDYNECININTSAPQIAELVKTMIEHPATTLLPRVSVLNGNIRGVDWSKELLYKF